MVTAKVYSLWLLQTDTERRSRGTSMASAGPQVQVYNHCEASHLLGLKSYDATMAALAEFSKNLLRNEAHACSSEKVATGCPQGIGLTNWAYRPHWPALTLLAVDASKQIQGFLKLHRFDYGLRRNATCECTEYAVQTPIPYSLSPESAGDLWHTKLIWPNALVCEIGAIHVTGTHIAELLLQRLLDANPNPARLGLTVSCHRHSLAMYKTAGFEEAMLLKRACGHDIYLLQRSAGTPRTVIEAAVNRWKEASGIPGRRTARVCSNCTKLTATRCQQCKAFTLCQQCREEKPQLWETHQEHCLLNMFGQHCRSFLQGEHVMLACCVTTSKSEGFKLFGANHKYRQADPQYGDRIMVTRLDPFTSPDEGSSEGVIGRSPAYRLWHGGLEYEVIYHHVMPHPGQQMHGLLAVLPYKQHWPVHKRGCWKLPPVLDLFHHPAGTSCGGKCSKEEFCLDILLQRLQHARSNS
ncbi:hypothetical protein WJX72_012227 [[Myrmecia] bisecta]|uniref:MYND-type domain-containing protein n=1 Tax=[Myrmecia] bisecta TaxID=41462 RepID=A0AAW1QGR6_9CHLO